jgi:nicotinamide-nucleotide amidase
VGDVAEDIRRTVRDALERAEVVVVTGGLGPTPDDLTRDAVAELLGLRLLVDENLLEGMRRRFLERGILELPPGNVRVAEVPEGARKLANPRGTAPGLALDAGGSLVVLLPGVPREMTAIADGELRTLLTERFAGRVAPVVLRVLHTTGMPESLLSAQIAERLPKGTGPIRLAFLPDLRGVDLRLTALGMAPSEAAGRLDELERVLEPVIAPWRYAAESGDLAESVCVALRRAGRTLGVAESCTGGLVTKRLTDVPGASRVLSGGVVAYANEAKVAVLRVDPVLVAEHGAVSEPVARAMALSAARAFGADVGLSVTGIAGPDGGTDQKPVGTVWCAVSSPGHVVARRDRFPGDRESVRERSAQAALFLLLRILDGREPTSGRQG